MLEEVKKLNAGRQAGSLRRPQHRRSRAPGRHLHRIQRFLPPGQPHPRRRKLRRRNQLLRRRSSHHHAGQGLHSRRRHAPRSQSRHLRRARSVRRVRLGRLAPAAPEIESLRVPFRLPRSASRRLRRPRRARHRPVSGTEGNQSGRRQRRIHAARIRRSARASTFRSRVSTWSRNIARPKAPSPR